MQKRMKITEGHPYPIGVTTDNKRINVSIRNCGKECGIILYNEQKKRIAKLSLSKSAQMGELCFGAIEIEAEGRYLYQLYIEDKIIVDSYMREYVGHEKFGEACVPEKLYGVIDFNEYDWENDRCPQIAYEDSVFYCLHVRGFTKHISSNVKGRGTYLGIQEKVPYLKELGVTAIELLPIIELQEKQKPVSKSNEQIQEINIPDSILNENVKKNLNYWGFAEGCYYVPRNSYSFSGNGVKEFKDLVKELHRNQIEVILQFYFPNEILQREIYHILMHWKSEYHVDGFHLKGEKLPLRLLAEEPGLKDTKLLYYDFPVDEIYGDKELVVKRNLAAYRDDYMYIMRRFLKGDEDMLNPVLHQMRRQPDKMAQINYFTNYYGFTLADMVSYERKHNEDNGEENHDGMDYNHTWNCGVEGKSRKKVVLNLRNKQIRNALCMLFFSQGTPLLFMGDEFGNTQNGNNNPYCQDNAISWLNWNQLESHKELFQYVKALIAFRKAHPILHKEKEMRLMDYLSCGYPDLSYHASKAWQPDMGNYNRHIALMYCGKYAKSVNAEEDAFIYVAMNMHWIAHEFALPKLPKGMQWTLIADTEKWDFEQKDNGSMNSQVVNINPRSINIYISQKEEGKK